MTRHLLTQPPSGRLDQAICRLTFGAVGPVSGGRESLGSTQLAIELGLGEQDHAATGCGRRSCHRSLLAARSMSMRRARQRRDITVPIGVSMIVAISLYDRPLSSCKTMHSRSATGNSARSFSSNL